MRLRIPRRYVTATKPTLPSTTGPSGWDRTAVRLRNKRRLPKRPPRRSSEIATALRMAIAFTSMAAFVAVGFLAAGGYIGLDVYCGSVCVALLTYVAAIVLGADGGRFRS